MNLCKKFLLPGNCLQRFSLSVMSRELCATSVLTHTVSKANLQKILLLHSSKLLNFAFNSWHKMIKSAIRNVAIVQGMKVSQILQIVRRFPPVDGTLNFAKCFHLRGDNKQTRFHDLLFCATWAMLLTLSSSSSAILFVISRHKQKAGRSPNRIDGAISATSEENKRCREYHCRCFRKGRSWQVNDSCQLGHFSISWRQERWDIGRRHIRPYGSADDEYKRNSADRWEQHDNSAGQLRSQMLINGAPCWWFKRCYLAWPSGHVSSPKAAQGCDLGK